MRTARLKFEDIVVSPELTRSGQANQFEERLRASIEEIGLAEPLKVARRSDGKHVVIDGVMRLNAITAIRANDPTAFPTVSAYVVDFSRRFELRYQTDIYQDLLPSQLAALVEHLHQAENVRKTDIARYIGVSPATLRNYTGLWRLVQRGGLFARVVELMDVGVLPASNPYAWLRLTKTGLCYALEMSFSDGEPAADWVEWRVARARAGDVAPFAIKYVEAATDALPTGCYREVQEIRRLKRDLGLRRRAAHVTPDISEAIRHLNRVSRLTNEPVLKSAARSLRAYMQ